MRRLGIASSLVAFALLIVLPGSVLASGAYSQRFLWNYCGSTYNWTSFSRVRFTADGTSTATKLTIDSKLQEMDSSTHGHFVTVQTWPTVTSTFPDNGDTHQLSVKRHANGGVDVSVRVVYTLRAWGFGVVIWGPITMRSVAC